MILLYKYTTKWYFCCNFIYSPYRWRNHVSIVELGCKKKINRNKIMLYNCTIKLYFFYHFFFLHPHVCNENMILLYTTQQLNRISIVGSPSLTSQTHHSKSIDNNNTNLTSPPNPKTPQQDLQQKIGLKDYCCRWGRKEWRGRGGGVGSSLMMLSALRGTSSISTRQCITTWIWLGWVARHNLDWLGVGGSAQLGFG